MRYASLLHFVSLATILGLLAFTIGGCSKYNERDKELYLSDVEDVITLYAEIQIPHPKYEEVQKDFVDSKRATGGKVDKLDLADAVYLSPANPIAALAEAQETFRRKYTKTPIDEELGMLAKLNELHTSAAAAWGANEASILGKILTEIEEQEGQRTSPEPPSDSDVKLAIEDFQKRLGEVEEAIKKARE